MSVTLLTGDAATLLDTLAAESVQTCVTSPPYFGLRNYGMDGQIGLESRPSCGGHGKVRLRADLTPEQREFVIRRLAE